MRLPNKVTSYQESILSRFNIILDILNDDDMSLNELFDKTKHNFINISEFIDTIDALFSLGKVEYNEDLEVLHYVD